MTNSAACPKCGNRLGRVANWYSRELRCWIAQVRFRCGHDGPTVHAKTAMAAHDLAMTEWKKANV